jgi:hypothetical protein
MVSPTKKIRWDSGLQGIHNGNITNKTMGDEHRGVKLSNGVDLLKHKPQRNPNKILEGHVPLSNTSNTTTVEGTKLEQGIYK